MKVSRIQKTDQEVMRELRLFREFSYRDVASLMGISHSRVQQLELDKKPLSEETKLKFLVAIKLSCEDWNLLKRGDQPEDSCHISRERRVMRESLKSPSSSVFLSSLFLVKLKRCSVTLRRSK